MSGGNSRTLSWKIRKYQRRNATAASPNTVIPLNPATYATRTGAPTTTADRAQTLRRRTSRSLSHGRTGEFFLRRKAPPTVRRAQRTPRKLCPAEGAGKAGHYLFGTPISPDKQSMPVVNRAS